MNSNKKHRLWSCYSKIGTCRKIVPLCNPMKKHVYEIISTADGSTGGISESPIGNLSELMDEEWIFSTELNSNANPTNLRAIVWCNHFTYTEETKLKCIYRRYVQVYTILNWWTYLKITCDYILPYLH